MFKITITEVTSSRKTVDEWQRLTAAVDSKYAYVPHEKDVTNERNVLTQEVETLDLAAVIKAVNGL